jgi:protein subunit release factor B
MDAPYVSKSKHDELARRLARLGIRDEDLEEKFIRSSGPGGQRANKTATCVYLKHKPSGITVKCQRERYRALNRFLARRTLADKIENVKLGKLSAEQQRREKIRRQKRRRSRRAKARMLENKRVQSEKKRLRKPLRPHRLENA